MGRVVLFIVGDELVGCGEVFLGKEWGVIADAGDGGHAFGVVGGVHFVEHALKVGGAFSVGEGQFGVEEFGEEAQ